MRRPPGPIGLLRRGRTVSIAVLNAWQGMTDDAEARVEREMLSPGWHSDYEGNWLEAIGTDDCWRLMAGVSVGRIGFAAHSGVPLILPVNYSVADRRLYIRTGRGPKLEAARRGDLVAFQVDEIDLQLRTGWSVTMTGRARWVSDPSELAALERVAPSAWAPGPRNELIALDPLHVAGRRLCAAADAR